MSGRPAAAFPWGPTMAFGLGALRLPPAAFWAATPREIAAAANGLAGRIGGGPRRADLDELMARFPDAASGAEEG